MTSPRSFSRSLPKKLITKDHNRIYAIIDKFWLHEFNISSALTCCNLNIFFCQSNFYSLDFLHHSENPENLSNQTLSATKKEGERSNSLQDKIPMLKKRITQGYYNSKGVLEIIAEKSVGNWLNHQIGFEFVSFFQTTLSFESLVI